MAIPKCGGTRLLKRQQPFNNGLPSISVITVTYNRFEDLSNTFFNVVSQTYENIEYIIIDGGSDDGSVNFLQNNNNKIAYWVSEKDAGIYDAMNKGALAATGDWIVFMNSGDRFFAEDTLARVAKYLQPSVDVVYGKFESILVDKYQTRVLKRDPSHLSEIWRQIPTCHQSIFVRRELQVKYLFDTSLNWCADHDFLVRLYANGYKFQEINLLVAKFDASGGENRDLLSYTRERWRISKHLVSPWKRHTYFLREYYKFWIWKNILLKIRNILPYELVIFLRKSRHKS